MKNHSRKIFTYNIIKSNPELKHEYVIGPKTDTNIPPHTCYIRKSLIKRKIVSPHPVLD